jgi:hypothetical protein
MSARLSDAKVAHNLVMWSVFKDNFEDSKHASYGVFSLKIDEKSVNEKLSANPWKAIKLFQMCGCDLMKSTDFSEVKNVVGTVVEKRNNVVHRNDLANDISLSDVKSYIVIFKKYIGSVSSSCQLVEPLDL